MLRNLWFLQWSLLLKTSNIEFLLLQSLAELSDKSSSRSQSRLGYKTPPPPPVRSSSKGVADIPPIPARNYGPQEAMPRYTPAPGWYTYIIIHQNRFVFTFEPCHEIMILFVLRKLILQTRMRSHQVGIDGATAQIFLRVWYDLGQDHRINVILMA